MSTRDFADMAQWSELLAKVALRSSLTPVAISAADGTHTRAGLSPSTSTAHFT